MVDNFLEFPGGWGGLPRPRLNGKSEGVGVSKAQEIPEGGGHCMKFIFFSQTGIIRKVR